ncbi:hypothetical protein Vqi01_00680 [Micromonospora qiuiae]|uniref:Uncharacterized protein n=1 Tax=Micromonospora qiuiae TaxID=502268 RepID=A0ABQ4J4E5_9ACTN|nr:hypothetical protein Vqi01_00680 [Micromonospora qiuiae]
MAAWPRWVASYGVMPQTYIFAAPSGSVACTPCRAESNNLNGPLLPGNRGTSCPTQDSMSASLTSGGAPARRLGQ